jgi:hypothetical protein
MPPRRHFHRQRNECCEANDPNAETGGALVEAMWMSISLEGVQLVEEGRRGSGHDGGRSQVERSAFDVR